MRLARRSSSEEPRRDDELEALLQAARAAAEHAEPERALEAILDGAIRLVGGDEGSVQLLDATAMTLGVVAARGLGPTARRQVVALGQGISGTVAVTGQALLLPSAIDVDRFVGHVPKERPIYGALCVPMRTREEIIGVLSVNRTRSGLPAFTDRDLRLITLFAETAAHALVHSRLLAETRRHAVELEMLRGATMRLGSSLEVETVAETALAEALAIAGAESGFICVVSEDGTDLELARFAGLPAEAISAVLFSPGFRRAVPTAEVRIVTDLIADPVLEPLASAVAGGALALVPLRTPEGHCGAVIGLALHKTVNAETKRLLGTYASQAGLAMANATLHRKVAAREQQFETMVAALEIPIVLLDGDGRFRIINRAAALAFRLSPEFEIGQDANGKLDPEVADLAFRDEDITAEILLMRAGVEQRFRVTAASVGSEVGQPSRIVMMVDVSQQHDLERRKADFLAVIGHELRTPLTSIKGYAFTLSRRAGAMPPQAQREALDSILAQSQRLERLIEDLLYISKVENDRPRLHLGWDDVTAIVDDVVAEVGAHHTDRTILIDRQDDDLPIYTDRVKIEQVVAHLLDNALKYSEAAVRVRILAAQGSVAVSVTDAGPGIYTGDLERIFDPFTQLDGSATRTAGGTGVGLYVCRTLAETLGGRIEVDSALGKGSTFTVVLPRKSGNPQAEDG